MPSSELTQVCGSGVSRASGVSGLSGAVGGDDLSTGDGVYVSRDGGKSWTNTGLRDGQQISAVVVDPKDERRASQQAPRPARTT